MTPASDGQGSRYPFPLDPFQLDALAALDAGRHVVVAAPTGSGKTVVAEHGIELARRRGVRAFYTAPIKALSNQKYRDLVTHHGDDEVGLLTGDNSINADAPIVVMTTEVLRNMIYGRRSLDDLGLVVLDEVHFLQDAYRGPVWEEVIIHLPHHVQLVCLSATVSNTNELAEWIGTVRGDTDAVIEHRRPVRLDNHYLVGDRTNDRLHLLPVFTDGRPNADAARLDASGARPPRGRDAQRRPARGSGRRVLYTPGRVETVQLLERRSMLPAIVFIFSRNQCDEAARACLDAGLRLTEPDEVDRIRAIVDSRLGSLDRDDLAVLGIERFLAQLEAGVAAHHAGMVPPFKEVVEACFVEGLTKVVFATETLAVGINMPARTVVIEKLTKYTGDHHEQLTPGQYTQLTGRAGRRGIDELGHAVVAWSPFVRFDQVADLAGSRSFHLRSVFRPTYNMAANLVRNYSDADARHLLNLSFAQFQSDRDVVRIEARLDRQRTKLQRLRADAESPYGDIDEYRREHRRRDVAGADDEATENAMAALRPGSVIRADTGKYRGPVAVIATARRRAGHRLTVVTPNGDSVQLGARELDGPPVQVGTIKLPPQYAPNRREYRRDVGRRLRSAKLESRSDRRARQARGDSTGSGRHPVELDPDLRDRMRAAGQADHVEREIRDLEARATRHHQSLAQEFDAVLEVLSQRGYVDRERWTLSPVGEILARTFHESDLLVAECVRLGLLDGLDPADLAGLASMFVYEHRSPDDPPRPWFPSGALAERARRVAAVSADLAADERAAGLAEHRAPDPTFFAVAHAWAAGEGFADVVGEEELTGGDFVRTMRQLIDLLGQIAQVAPEPATRRAAAAAADASFRGVVADSAAVGVVAGATTTDDDAAPRDDRVRDDRVRDDGAAHGDPQG